MAVSCEYNRRKCELTSYHVNLVKASVNFAIWVSGLVDFNKKKHGQLFEYRLICIFFQSV